jgi:DUF4097 and DUF4098 domain-containing protein YvlB
MTHGAVLLSGAARRIEVDSVDGDVVARSAVAVTESFRATTANGDIEVDYKTAPRTLDATTDNGDIRIALPPRGPYLVNANTSDRSGDTVVRVPQTSDRKGAASVVTARSDTGAS